MDLQLKNKTALVTGSSSGIGFAIAKLLLQEGATVFINGRTEQSVNKAIEKLKAVNNNATVQGIAADFSNVNDVNRLIERLPSVDILVNNVGIFEPKPFAAINDEDWFRFYEVNVLSGVRLSRAYFPKMIEKNWGRIIFISSESALQVPEEMIHYGMTKTAQLAISRGLAELTKKTAVTVNTVLPGPTKSEGVEEFIKQLAAQQHISTEEAEKNFFTTARPTSILRRFISADEVANTVVYLSSPLASAINGAAVRSDGGVIKTIA